MAIISKHVSQSQKFDSSKSSFPSRLTLGIIIKSIIFNIAYVIGTTLFALFLIPFLIFPKGVIAFGALCWVNYINFLLRYIIGITYEIKGTIPSGPLFIASKHQSAWETILFYKILNLPIYLLKIELLYFPVLGWYFRKVKMIGIKRTKASFPFKLVISAMKKAFSEGKNIIIFPEGTRTDPFSHNLYKPGIALIYRELNKEVVPVAVNSGLFWGRRSFFKYPGKITVTFLKPILPGLSPKKFLEILENTIETESQYLREEALSYDKKS